MLMTQTTVLAALLGAEAQRRKVDSYVRVSYPYVRGHLGRPVDGRSRADFSPVPCPVQDVGLGEGRPQGELEAGPGRSKRTGQSSTLLAVVSVSRADRWLDPVNQWWHEATRALANLPEYVFASSPVVAARAN